MTARTARCLCGQLSVAVEGEPYGIAQCHCQACQRRTGSPFGVGAYYRPEQARIAGESQTFARIGASGASLINHFCPACGTNLFWYAELHQGGIGIATGCFDDPDFPSPVRSVWETTRHRWVEVTCADRFVEGSAGPRVG